MKIRNALPGAYFSCVSATPEQRSHGKAVQLPVPPSLVHSYGFSSFRTSSAPKARSSTRRSNDIDAGMVSTSL